MKLLRNFMGLLTLMLLSLTAQAQTFQMYTPMGVPSFLAKKCLVWRLLLQQAFIQAPISRIIP